MNANILHLFQYGIVFDAGSSHTSLFLYQWPGNKQNDTGIVSQAMTCDVKGRLEIQLYLANQYNNDVGENDNGSVFIGDGISSYAKNPSGAGDSLKECLDAAMSTVPARQYSNTPVYLGATAGMRLLK